LGARASFEEPGVPARDPHHQRAAARVAILARWRDADDPELVQARRSLEIARAEAHLAAATEAAVVAAAQLRALGPVIA
jgi:hypothetical protein